MFYMNQKIELGPSIVGQHYYLTETYGPYVRVTHSQGSHLDDGLIFWFKNTAPEQIKKVGEHTAWLGNILHGMFHGHLAGEKVVVEEESTQKPFDNFKAFCLEKGIRPVALEQRMVSRALGLGGTVDAVVDMDAPDGSTSPYEGRWVLDWKTGTESPSHDIQLAIYAVMWWELTGEWITNLAVVYIHRDGKKVKFVPVKSPITALMAGLFTFERWKYDNRDKLVWACAPNELVEKRKKTRGKNRIQFDNKEYKEEYAWPWLNVSSLRWLENFKNERKAK
jgi:hypothetical protein